MADEENISHEKESETKETTQVERPEYVPEKFWDVDNSSVNVESMASSYNALEKKLGSRTEELSKQVREDIEKERLGNVPKEYELKQPEIPDGVNIEINKDIPLLQWWEETAKNQGLSQDEFDKGIQQFIDNQISSLPSVEAEHKVLGDNAKGRIEAAELWAKKNLTTDGYNTVSNLASTANGVKVIEEMMKLTKDAPIPEADTAIEATPSLMDLRSMMNDPRYIDSSKRDPAYVEKVTKLYEKYYGKKPEAKG